MGAVLNLTPILKNAVTLGIDYIWLMKSFSFVSLGCGAVYLVLAWQLEFGGCGSIVPTAKTCLAQGSGLLFGCFNVAI